MKWFWNLVHPVSLNLRPSQWINKHMNAVRYHVRLSRCATSTRSPGDVLDCERFVWWKSCGEKLKWSPKWEICHQIQLSNGKCLVRYGWRNGAKFTKLIFIHIQCYFYYSRRYLFTFNNYVFIQEIYLFTFNDLILIHKNIHSHFTGCIHSHSTVYIRSHSPSKYWFNEVQYSFNIFCAPPLRIVRSGQRMTIEQETFVDVARWRLSRIVARSMNWKVWSGVVFMKKWDLLEVEHSLMDRTRHLIQEASN